jgi:hypothetical protein
MSIVGQMCFLECASKVLFPKLWELLFKPVSGQTLQHTHTQDAFNTRYVECYMKHKKVMVIFSQGKCYFSNMRIKIYISHRPPFQCYPYWKNKNPHKFPAIFTSHYSIKFCDQIKPVASGVLGVQ